MKSFGEKGTRMKATVSLAIVIVLIGSMRAASQQQDASRTAQQQAASDKATGIRLLDAPPPDLITVGEYSSELLAKAIQLGFISSVVKGAPYSGKGTTTIDTSLADGTRINRTINYTIYRDSAGRLRREDDQGIWISDPVAQVTYILDTKAFLARKVPLSRLLANAKRNAAQALSQTASEPIHGPGGQTDAGRTGAVAPSANAVQALGKQVMEGLTVEGSRSSTLIKVGQIGNDRPIETVTERWYSPDLQVVVMTHSRDPRSGVSIFRLTDIRRAEPDASLFTVPAGYKIEASK